MRLRAETRATRNCELLPQGRKYGFASGKFAAAKFRRFAEHEPNYLSSVERSERNVSIDNIGRIAKGLGTGSVSMSVTS